MISHHIDTLRFNHLPQNHIISLDHQHNLINQKISYKLEDFNTLDMFYNQQQKFIHDSLEGLKQDQMTYVMQKPFIKNIPKIFNAKKKMISKCDSSIKMKAIVSKKPQTIVKNKLQINFQDTVLQPNKVLENQEIEKTHERHEINGASSNVTFEFAPAQKPTIKCNFSRKGPIYQTDINDYAQPKSPILNQKTDDSCKIQCKPFEQLINSQGKLKQQNIQKQNEESYQSFIGNNDNSSSVLGRNNKMKRQQIRSRFQSPSHTSHKEIKKIQIYKKLMETQLRELSPSEDQKILIQRYMQSLCISDEQLKPDSKKEQAAQIYIVQGEADRCCLRKRIESPTALIKLQYSQQECLKKQREQVKDQKQVCIQQIGQSHIEQNGRYILIINNEEDNFPEVDSFFN